MMDVEVAAGETGLSEGQVQTPGPPKYLVKAERGKCFAVFGEPLAPQRESMRVMRAECVGVLHAEPRMLMACFLDGGDRRDLAARADILVNPGVSAASSLEMLVPHGDRLQDDPAAAGKIPFERA